MENEKLISQEKLQLVSFIKVAWISNNRSVQAQKHSSSLSLIDVPSNNVARTSEVTSKNCNLSILSSHVAAFYFRTHADLRRAQIAHQL